MEGVWTIKWLSTWEFICVQGVIEVLSQEGSDFLSQFAGEGNLVDFCITSANEIAWPVLRRLSVEPLPHEEAGIAPVRFGDMQLDWWLDIYKEDKSVLKNWGGTTTPC